MLWGNGMLILILGSGLYFSVMTGFFQIRKFPVIIRETILSVFKENKADKKGKNLSQFQAMATALAASMGTGNIAGVATALVIGGPGAIFWMWVSAILGMMLVFSENVLGIYYRYKNKNSEWIGGPMVYIERGLGMKRLGAAYAFFCILASLGMGNLAQSNSISTALFSAFKIPYALSGVIISVLAGIVIIGGLKKVGEVAEKVIPIVSILYILGSIIAIVLNFKEIPHAFKSIFSGAFGIMPAAGGVSGVLIKNAASAGVRRGIFSNEAGLGSSAIVHASSEAGGAVRQGMWGIFEVFVDTIICCTLTALVLLSSGVLDAGGGLDGAPLVIAAFSKSFGGFAGIFVSASLSLFAFATLIGWSFYGAKAAEYLFGQRRVIFYKIIFSAGIFIGAVLEIEVAWRISDIFNGLMALPNLVALLLLSKVVLTEIGNFKK